MTIFYPDIYDGQYGVNLSGQPAVVIKITEGNDSEQEYWQDEVTQANDLGIPYYFYHFLREESVTGESGASQAQYCFSFAGTTPVMLDWEQETYGDSTSNPQISDAQGFLNEFAALGGICNMIYLPDWYWSGVLDSPDLGWFNERGYRLVSSDYTTYSATGPGWDEYGNWSPTVWQYSDDEDINGTDCDYNAFLGTLAEWQQCFEGAPTNGQFFTSQGPLIVATGSTFTYAPYAVGDVIFFEVVNTSNNTVYATSMSSSNATWEQVGTKVLGSTNACTAVMFAGKITSTSSETVTIDWSGATPGTIRGAGQEFTPPNSGWSLDQQAHLDSAGTSTWPSITPSANHELYYGFIWNNSIAAMGYSSDYWYETDDSGNGCCFNVSCAKSAQAPTWVDSDQAFGIVITVEAGTTSFTAEGGIIQSTASTFSLTPQAVGDVIFFEVINVSNKTVSASSMSSSNATWEQVGTTVTGSTNSMTAVLFAGTVTSTSEETVTISWSGTTPATIRAAGQEFNVTGTWSLDIQGHVDSSGTSDWASLTPSRSGDLYFGYCWNTNVAIAGNSLGYLYEDDNESNGLAFDIDCTSSAQEPVWTDANQAFGLMALIKTTTSENYDVTCSASAALVVPVQRDILKTLSFGGIPAYFPELPGLMKLGAMSPGQPQASTIPSFTYGLAVGASVKAYSPVEHLLTLITQLGAYAAIPARKLGKAISGKVAAPSLLAKGVRKALTAFTGVSPVITPEEIIPGITVVQSALITGSSGSFANDVTAYNCVILCIAADAGGAAEAPVVEGCTLGDLPGNFISLGADATIADSSGNPGTMCAFWADPLAEGGVSDVAVTMSSGTCYAIWALEVTGMGGGPELDQYSSVLSKTGTETWSSGTTGTTTSANELALGMTAHGEFVAPGEVLTGPSSPWVNSASYNTGTTGYTALFGYDILSSEQTVTYSGASGTNFDYYTAIVITLKSSIVPTIFGPLYIVFPGGGVTKGGVTIALAKPAVEITGTFALTVRMPKPKISLAGTVEYANLKIVLPVLKTAITGLDTHNNFNITLPRLRTSLSGVVVHWGAMTVALSQRYMGFLYSLADLEEAEEEEVLTPARWLTGALALNWKKDAVYANWRFVGYSQLLISHLSTEYVLVPVQATKSGASYDPTSDPVQFAFMPNNVQQPVTDDWVNGSWDTDSANIIYPYSAKCLVGPSGDIFLAQGSYVIYVQIFDNPETPVLTGGILVVS